MSPGTPSLNERRARLRTLRDAIGFGPPDADGVRAARLGRGTVLGGDDLERLLQRASVSRESLVDLGLQVARRRHDDGRYYFIVNSGDRDVQGWIPLDDRAPAAVLFDPMTGRHGDARIRRSSAGALEVRLAIPSHGSLIVATTSKPVGRRFPTFEPAGPAIEIRGPWQVRFVAGGPDRPRDRERRPASVVDAVRRRRGEAIFRHRRLPDHVRADPREPPRPGCWILAASTTAHASCSTAATWAP